MEIKINELNYNIIKRQEEKDECGNILKHGSESIDFLIDGKSLLNIFIENYGNNERIGCFNKGWEKYNKNSKNQLLVKIKPETKNGRVLIYVCPECGHIGCGAFCCKIKKENGLYIWSDFAFENDWDDEIWKHQYYNNIGPFYFNKKKYEKIISNIYIIMK